MRLVRFAILPGAVACVACGGQGMTSGSMSDAGPQPPDDAGACGSDRHVTGELLDLDATTSQPAAISGARLTVDGTPARTATTAPGGRFQLCAPPGRSMTLDLDAPADYLDGKVYLEAEALAHRPPSLRAYTRLRAASLYAFDASLGHILIFLAGDRSDLILDRPHGAPLSGNDDDGDGVLTWEAGNAGRYVLFPNVDVSSPTVTLTGDLSGPHTLPVAAGTLTLAAIFFVYL